MTDAQKTWIARASKEPETHMRVLVWHEHTAANNVGTGPVVAVFDYEEWVDVVDCRSLYFHWWMPAPLAPTGSIEEIR